jgi:hypothetical protein
LKNIKKIEILTILIKNQCKKRTPTALGEGTKGEGFGEFSAKHLPKIGKESD